MPATKRDKDGLTPKQEAFTREYPIDNNGKQAAIRAGFSAKTAKEQAVRLLANVNVARAVAKHQAATAKKLQLTEEMVIAGLLKETEPTGEKGQANSRVSAWANLGKHLGMFTDRLAVSGADGGAVELIVLERKAKGKGE
jgi:phage terminase small subunit